ATVTSGAGTPTGSVTFTIDGSSVGTVGLNGSGVATFSTSTLSAGSHPVVAQYNGGGAVARRAANTVTQVVAAATTTALTSSHNPSDLGQSVTFTATVTSGARTPTGSVTFTIDGNNAGSIPLNGSGVATFSTSTLSAGSHPVVAIYAGG